MAGVKSVCAVEWKEGDIRDTSSEMTRRQTAVLKYEQDSNLWTWGSIWYIRVSNREGMKQVSILFSLSPSHLSSLLFFAFYSLPRDSKKRKLFLLSFSFLLFNFFFQSSFLPLFSSTFRFFSISLLSFSLFFQLHFISIVHFRNSTNSK